MNNGTNRFVEYLQQEQVAAKNGSPNWERIKRDFKRIYSSKSVKHFPHFAKYNIPVNQVNVLIAYMVGKGVVDVNHGVNVGTAMKLIDRNEKTLEQLISLPTHRLIPKLKQLTGLMVSHNVKLDMDTLSRDLYCWDNQSDHHNPNWVIKSWVNSYYKRKGDEHDFK